MTELLMKTSSIPETEPLYKIIQSRTMKINEIKDKNERKYWRRMKQVNKIPEEYLPIRKRGEKKFDYKGLGRV